VQSVIENPVATSRATPRPADAHLGLPSNDSELNVPAKRNTVRRNKGTLRHCDLQRCQAVPDDMLTPDLL
jgi:hypothetical protein